MESTHTKIGQNGRVVIPAAYRQATGLNVGDEVVLRVENGEIILASRVQQIRRAQELVRQCIPAGKLLSEELIANRRAEEKGAKGK